MSLLHWLELEEQVGKRWHRWISGGVASYPFHSAAAVTRTTVQPSLAVFFRALGGDPGIQLAGCAATGSAHRLSWRQKLGLDEERLEQPRLDDTTMVLPEQIGLFTDPSLNRSLYYWLAAFFAASGPETPAGDGAWAHDLAFLRQAHLATRRALAAWPGLVPLHGELCRALLAIRPRRVSLPAAEQAVEEVVLGLLGQPAAGPLWAYVTAAGPLPAGLERAAYKPFLPVPLWGEATGRVCLAPAGPEDADEEPEAGAAKDADAARKAGARRHQDQADRQDSLIFNRFEKILSLADMVNVNRDVDDDDEENAQKAAADMDEITLSKHRRRPAVKLKFDLDLAPEAAIGTPLDGEQLYPEWDYRRAAYHRDHCRVVTSLAAEEGETWEPDAAARRRIQRVRRQFEALRPRHTLVHRQNDGDDLDLEAVVRSRCDLLANGIGSDQVFTQFRKTARDLSASFLVDVSLSTDAWVQNRRVLDVEKEALTTLCHGLRACGDEYAIHTFTSRRRSLVKVATVKGFDEPFGERVTRRISALKPGYYTRMGAAIRHVAGCLADRPHRHRLLVLLTDGKPNDVDHYEGRYGIEDSRKAVQEARRAGIAVFGVTIDRKAQDYFPQLFGRGGYAIVDDIARLPAALPKIYRQLVTR